MASRIFISHALIDNGRCDPYVAALRMRGATVWYQPYAEQFGPLTPEVQEALATHKTMIVLLTQNAIDSFWVKQEMRLFLDLMSTEPDRQMLLVQIGPCHVQPGLPPGVETIDALLLPIEMVVDQIMDVIGQPTIVTPAQTTIQGITNRINLSRRQFLTIGGVAASAALAGSAAWLLTHKSDSATASGPRVNVADPGTPSLIWTPNGGQPISIPLRHQQPLSAIDLRDHYRIDALLGGFDFDSNSADLACVVSGIPLIFGSQVRPGHYAVAAPKCFAPVNPSDVAGGPLSSLVIAYTFGGGAISPPCATNGDGTKLCFPTQKPAKTTPISDTDATNAVTQYYQAIKSGDYMDAYGMLALAAKGRQSLVDFTTYWSVGPIDIEPRTSPIGQNGDGSVALSLTYDQTLADGISRWQATVVVQVENGAVSVMPLGRIKLGNSITPTPTAGTPTVGSGTPKPTP